MADPNVYMGTPTPPIQGWVLDMVWRLIQAMERLGDFLDLCREIVSLIGEIFSEVEDQES